MTAKTNTSRKSGSRRKLRSPWHLVTNHQNMLFMLAADMAMAPAGFRGKHYADCLEVWPGWVPLFRNRAGIPAAVVDYATRERRHLRPCIATFDLSLLSGPCLMLSWDGSLREISSPAARKRKNDIAILVRAPLPLTLLSGIGFRSLEDWQAFESAVGDVSNVQLSLHRVEVAESIFSMVTTGMGMNWPPMPAQGQLFGSGVDDPPTLGQAIGGVLAMLYHLANRSDLGLAAFRLATEPKQVENKDPVRANPILAGLPNWMDGGRMPEQTDIGPRLFWEVVQALISAQMRESTQTPVDVALASLESCTDLSGEEEFRRQLKRLIADLRSLGGLGGGTVTELLERHKGYLFRALLLFCLREHCTELLEFSHPLLCDTDYLLAGILFGVRDSWLRLPGEFRNADLSFYTAWRMAKAEHRIQGSHLVIAAPPRPKPLRWLFSASDGEWDRFEEDAALEMAVECGWSDCIQTRIILAEGDHPTSFERKGLQVMLPGRVSAVAEIVDKDRFLCRLGRWPPVAPRIESAVRRKLASARESGDRENGNGSSCA